MVASFPKVVAYGYAASPMWRKVHHALLLRRIPYSSKSSVQHHIAGTQLITSQMLSLVVNVKNVPPRPELLQLGITYRRIPVLFIDNEAFFDTNLIFLELERRFKDQDGFPSLLCKIAAIDRLAR